MTIAADEATLLDSPQRPRAAWLRSRAATPRGRAGPARPLTVLHVATINKAITSEIGYGPIETVIYNIDRGLHALGHRSIVACSADSKVTGEQLATVPYSLGDYWQSGSPQSQSMIAAHLAHALERAQQGDIDIVHMHEWFERVYDGSFRPPVPIVMTLHVPGSNSGVAEFRARNPGLPEHAGVHFVAISEHQRGEYASLLPVAATVPHGIDVDARFKAALNHGSYLFSIGRVTDVKGQDLAIEVARRSGKTLILAGCVQAKDADRAFFARLQPSIDLTVDVRQYPVGDDYYDRVIAPLLASGKRCIYVGELDTAAKKHWYRHAQATLFPIRWGEPFGMVLIESMASGTPVIALGKGAVPEIVRDGETGFVVDSVDAMVEAVGRIDQLDRRACWQHVKRQFSIENMAAAYVELYGHLVFGRERIAAATSSGPAAAFAVSPAAVPLVR